MAGYYSAVDTCQREKLAIIGAKVVSHGRRDTIQLAEVASWRRWQYRETGSGKLCG